jgi:hypothetical protein
MVDIHLDANYIFCITDLIKNQNEDKMITAYQKMVNRRMKLLALGLKYHCLDNKCLAAFKACMMDNFSGWSFFGQYK